MKDKFGYERGGCKKCSCDEFIFQEESVRCGNCTCKPVDHEISLSPANKSSPGHSEIAAALKNTSNSFSCVIYQGSRCSFPGCCDEVMFDLNTGREFVFCSLHKEPSIGVVTSDIDQLVVEDIESIDMSQTALQQVMGCSQTRLCAIPECQNPCHVDEDGTVHECCGYTHAMEHQRRQGMLQAVGANILKGVTHCLLTECNNPTWPFENYCSRTHADIGKQRGLISPNTERSDSNDDSTCIFPNCKSPKFAESDGKTVYPYCGKTHAKLAKQLGIFPTTSKLEEQCELEECTRLRYKEGTRIHDYCCKEHAVKDAPNREAKMLTSIDEVNKWLKQFKKLTVLSLEENPHAKPGGTLFIKFREKMMSLPKDQRKTCLAFHGTSAQNIDSVCKNGYDPSKRRRQAYGVGEYFATTPDLSMQYCKGGKKMLLNELLLGTSGKDHTKHDNNIIVMKEPTHDLPRFVITFK